MIHLPVSNDTVDGPRDAVRVVIQTQVAEKHGTRQQQSGGVGLVLALDIQTDVSATGLEHGDVAPHVAAGDDTGTANQGGADVGQNATVEVGHDHDIKLLGLGDSLHAGVVHNHVVNLNGGVVGSN